MKTTSDITLYDLMAQELEVYVKKNKQFGYDITIEFESGTELMHEEHMHPCAVESFAEFCKRFVHFYELANSRSEVK